MKPEVGRPSTTNVSKVIKVAESQNGNVLYEWGYSPFNVEAGIFALHGETTLYMAKTPETGTDLTLTATNV